MTFRSAEELADRGLLRPDAVADLAEVAASYAVAVTPTMADLIDPGDPADPIARQFIPDVRERVMTPVERVDPIGDAAHSPCEGLIHRYPDRVLLKLVQVCAVYCRFCFRRESVGSGAAAMLAPAAVDRALAYIAGRPEIWEVILSGGDPLVLAPRRLASLTARLAAISHVRILRIHTRVPVVAPDRVDDDLIDALRASGKTLYVAIHANHARELTPAARAACSRLQKAGCTLVSQTVLLRGVNDSVEALATLMRTFVEAGIKPYYLHHPDLAPGTSHFRLPIAEGQALMRALRGRLSGLCQPHYVLDIPGGHGKSPLDPAYVRTDERGETRVTDFNGVTHAYPPRS